MRKKIKEHFNGFKDLFHKGGDEINVSQKDYEEIEEILINPQTPAPSKYYDKVNNNNIEKRNGVFLLALVSFHQKRGSVVEKTFPEKESILSSDIFDVLRTNDTQSNEEIFVDIMNQLSYFCLPDGIHAVNKDTEIFLIQNYKRMLFCVFSYKQIQTSNQKVIDDFQENTRDCVQKSLCVVSLEPFTQFYIEKVSICMEAFMLQENLNNKAVINLLYNNLVNETPNISWKNMLYKTFSLKKLITFLEADLITVIKCILLEKKILIFSLVPTDSVLMIMSLLTLIPGNIFFNLDPKNLNDSSEETKKYLEHLAQYGYPLKIFNDKCLLYPSFTLFDLDYLTSQNPKGYLIGSSNALTLSTNELKNDCVIHIDEGKVKYNNIPESILKLSQKEKELYQNICKVLNLKADKKKEKKEAKGSWLYYDYFYTKDLGNEMDKIEKDNRSVVELIKNYFDEFFSDLSLGIETFYKDMKTNNQEEKKTNDQNSETEDEDWENLSSRTFEICCLLSYHNFDFVKEWIKTENFLAWLKEHSQVISALSPHCGKRNDQVIKYENGDSYTGSLLCGKRHGKGNYMYFSEKLVYIGLWEKDKRKGQGNLSNKDSNYLYEGEWDDDKMSGNGSLITNEEKYVGKFSNNKYQGEGCLILKDGTIYKGQFNLGKKEGIGSLKKIDGETYEGDFVNDLFDGMGKLHTKEGDSYEGNFKNGFFEGDGLFKKKDGNSYIGKFKKGKFDGEGVLIDKDNQIIQKGKWIEGEFVKVP